MTENNPGDTPGQTPETEPTAVLPTGEPADSAPVEGRPGGRRTAVVVASVVAVALVLGGGAFAAYRVFASSGPQADEALPASTVALVSLDLDPSAKQKVEAIKTIRKFPALKKELGLDVDDDLREWVFKKATGSGDCKELDYAKDIEPWIGKRIALGAVDLGAKQVTPAIALQITDADAAKRDFAKLVKCSDPGEDFGFTVGKDYLIASDSEANAKKIVAAAEKSTLADSAAYRKQMDQVGDLGVISFYVAPKGLKAMVEGLGGFGSAALGGSVPGEDDFPSGLSPNSPSSSTERPGGLPSESATAMPSELRKQLEELEKQTEESQKSGSMGNSVPRPAAPAATPAPGADAQLDKALKDFKGMAGTVRFSGGGMELSAVGEGAKQLTSGGVVGKQMGALPKDTTLALGFGVPDDFAKTVVDQLQGELSDLTGDLVAEAKESLGLTLPQDLEDLLGDSVTLSLSGDAPNLKEVKSPEDVPVGLVIRGDGAKIRAVIAKIEEATGQQLADLPIYVKESKGQVTLSPSKDYADALTKSGSLKDSSAFKSVVPEADKANMVFYVHIDSKWRTALVDLAKELSGSSTARDVDANSKVLEAIGLSTWTDGPVSHSLLKITTK